MDELSGGAQGEQKAPAHSWGFCVPPTKLFSRRELILGWDSTQAWKELMGGSGAERGPEDPAPPAPAPGPAAMSR